MTTQVFQWAGTAIGTYFGGPVGGYIGGAIGTTLGAYVDGQIIAALMPPDQPRMDDLRVTASTYGKILAILLGDEVRVGGNIVWSSGIVETHHGGKGGPPNPEYSYSVDLAIAIGEGELDRVRKIWANGKVIYDETADGPPLPPSTPTGYEVTRLLKRMGVFQVLRFYPGSSVQNPDPTIEAYLGVGNVPRYKGTCYLVLQGLQLADYGNRIPQLDFLISCKPGQTVGAAAAEIISRAGINPDTVGVSGLTMELDGYAIGNSANAVGVLQPMAMIYQFDLAEVWGALRLQPRGTALAGVIDERDLGAGDSGNAQPEKIRWPRRAETDLPQRAQLTFPDPDRDFQPTTQSTPPRVSGNAHANVSFDSPIVMSADKGAEITDKLLWEAWTGRQTTDTSVTDRYIHVEPGRSYVIVNANARERVKVTKNTRGANGVHRLELRKDRVENYRSTRVGAITTVPTNEISLPGETAWIGLDIATLLEANDDSGFYWAANGELPGWRGADLLRSLDDVTFQNIGRVGFESVFGDVAVATISGPSHIWDLVTTISVALQNDDEELSSASELEVLNGANLIWIGDPDDSANGELLQYQTATLTAPGVYLLSGLLRGRFGTEHAIAGHGANEKFVLLGIDATQRNDFGAGDWNRERFYKPVSVMQDAADVTSIPFTNTGESKRPYSVTDIETARDVSNNVSGSFFRRSRIPAPGLGYGPTPLGEAVEAYEIDILSGATVVGTISTATPAFAYSAAAQTAAGLTPGNPVSGVIYQISDVRGRGHGANFTIA